MGRSATLTLRILSVLLTIVLAIQVVQPLQVHAAGPLSVSKAVQNVSTLSALGTTATATPGNVLQYVLTYQNAATSTASPIVTIVDPLQAGQTFNGNCSATSPGATCTNTAGTVTITIPSVPALGTGTATFQVTVNPGVSGTLFNSATISDALGNSSTSTTTTAVTVSPAVTSTALTATKTVQNVTTGGVVAASATASPGNTLRYFLNYANPGATAASVTLTDTLAAGQNFLGCAPAPCSLTGSTVTFGPYAVSAGGGGQATLDVQVAPTFNGTLTNTFTASAPTATGATSAPTTVSVAGTALSGAGIEIEKQVSNISTGGAESAGITASPGNTVRYYLLVGANALQQSATGIVVTDTLQGGQAFANHCSVPCTFDGVNTVRLTAGNLAPGTQTLVTFDATINAATCGQIITNRAGAAATNSNAATSNGTSIVVQGSCTPPPVIGPVSYPPVTCQYSCTPPPTVCPNTCSYTPPYYNGYGSCGYYYACNGCSNAAYGCVGSAYSRTITVCGSVQTYQAPAGATPGYITMNGEAFILMPYMVSSGTTVTVGASFCLTLTVNGTCQVTSMIVAPNVAAANYLCGTVTPYSYGYAPWGSDVPYANYSPYPGYTPNFGTGTTYGPYALSGPYAGYYGYSGPMLIGGYPYAVSQNVAFPFSVSYGNPYCFLQNNTGAITGSLSVIPTAATAVESPSGTRRAHGAGSV
ncbi:MAG: hypothetical protein NVSMB22_01920 [Chloroflexota bacterium]